MREWKLNDFNFKSDRLALGDAFCNATESPLVHDGSQTTAAADLSTKQFYAVAITGSRAVNLASTGGENVYGILQNKPSTGEAADIGIMGVSKAVAGAVVTAGNFLMTDTAGRLVPATGTSARVAQAIESAAATSTVFTVAIVPGSLSRTAT